MRVRQQKVDESTKHLAKGLLQKSGLVKKDETFGDNFVHISVRIKLTPRKSTPKMLTKKWTLLWRDFSKTEISPPRISTF